MSEWESIETAPKDGTVIELGFMRGQLSKDVNFRLVTSGDIGPKEITNLIRLLEAQRYVITEFDVDEPKPTPCEERLSP